MRGCLTLILGFLLGAGLMLYWWPQQPRGVVAPKAADLRVTISDSFLAREVQSHLAGQTAPAVSNVRINSIPPAALVVDADLSAGPVSTGASTEVQPVISGGQIQVNVISSRVAGIPIPSQLTGVLRDAINGRLSNLLGADARATGVRVLPAGIEIDADHR